ncbi:hypothetical protein SAMN05421681_102598 [Lysobacter enzymogenes]|nr:hypothetical protein SAMN05421681_102598 [Lysobacter enzymogenes]
MLQQHENDVRVRGVSQREVGMRMGLDKDAASARISR